MKDKSWTYEVIKDIDPTSVVKSGSEQVQFFFRPNLKQFPEINTHETKVLWKTRTSARHNNTGTSLFCLLYWRNTQAYFGMNLSMIWSRTLPTAKKEQVVCESASEFSQKVKNRERSWTFEVCNRNAYAPKETTHARVKIFALHLTIEGMLRQDVTTLTSQMFAIQMVLDARSRQAK